MTLWLAFRRLALYVVRTVMNKLEYRREDGRNVLVMRKRLPGRA